MGASAPTRPDADTRDTARVHLLASGAQADELSLEDATRVKVRGDRLLWIDVDLEAPDSEELFAAVAERADVEPHAAGRLLTLRGKPHADDHGELLRVEVVGLNAGTEPSCVTCLVGDNWVVTAHNGEARFVEDFRDALAGGSEAGALDAPAFLAVLLGWQVRTYQEAVDRLTEEVDELDQALLSADPPGTGAALERLVDMRTRLSRMRRLLAPHRAAYQRLSNPDLDRLSTSDSAAAFADLKDDTDDTVESIQSAREMLLGSFEILSAQASQRTNNVMKTLTFVSIVLLPSTLIAGIMGMNFKPALFEHSELFWVTVATILILMGVTLAVAWRRGWVGSSRGLDGFGAKAASEDSQRLEESREG